MPQFERHVTHAEAVKGHITIRERYRPVFEKHFGKLLHEDDPKGSEQDFYKDFFREDTKERVRLKLCMRNQDRKEIRLYLSKKKKNQGYRIDGNRILSVEFRRGKAFISSKPAGLVKPHKLYPRDKNRRVRRLPRPDDEESHLNNAFNGAPKLLTRKERQDWARSRRLVGQCLRKAGFSCEAGWTGNRFKSKATRQNYAEVHHLIPRKYQHQFNESVDTLLNLCCLSPQAHRAIHHGTDEQVIQLLQHLLQKRPVLKKQFQISEDILFRMYGVE
jgi:hypothetical protein